MVYIFLHFEYPLFHNRFGPSRTTLSFISNIALDGCVIAFVPCAALVVV